MNQKGEESESLLYKKVERGSFAVISPVLDPDEESEWLISDGTEVIPVVIQDEEFLQAVKEGQVGFASGCNIVCVLETTQWLTGEGVRSDYRVSCVTEITPGDDA